MPTNVNQCTFSTNLVSGGLGGNGQPGELSDGNAGNGGNAQGAGVYNGQSGWFIHADVVNNIAQSGPGGLGGNGTTGPAGTGNGGGIWATTSTTFILDTLVALNLLQPGGLENGSDISGAITSQGYNLIGATNGSSGWTTNDLADTILSPLNPLIGPLQDNGGPTLTHALLSSAFYRPAI